MVQNLLSLLVLFLAIIGLQYTTWDWRDMWPWTNATHMAYGSTYMYILLPVQCQCRSSSFLYWWQQDSNSGRSQYSDLMVIWTFLTTVQSTRGFSVFNHLQKNYYCTSRCWCNVHFCLLLMIKIVMLYLICVMEYVGQSNTNDLFHGWFRNRSFLLWRLMLICLDHPSLTLSLQLSKIHASQIHGSSLFLGSANKVIH